MIAWKKGFLKTGEGVESFGNRFVIITDERVETLYGKNLLATLLEKGVEAYLFSFPPGEKSKTRGVKEALEDALFAKKLGPDICIIALGGGVVTDLAGFLAATYCRGVPLLSIPTTLMGMVDASLGGKNGVNHPAGKNLIGTFYLPSCIIIDTECLNTLDIKEMRNGWSEMIKHALIADSSYFTLLEGGSFPLDEAIERSIEIKLSIVAQSTKDYPIRHLLNFGHTVAHALEHLSNYSLPHGNCVAIGLMIESYLSLKRGFLSEGDFSRIQSLLHRTHPSLEFPLGVSPKEFLQALLLDKKSLGGTPRFVLLEKIGSPLSFNNAFCAPCEPSLLLDAFEWSQDALCCH